MRLYAKCQAIGQRTGHKSYNEYFQENKDKIMQEIQLAEAKKRAQMKNAGAYSKVKDYQTPFTALQIDNTKRGMSVAGK